MKKSINKNALHDIYKWFYYLFVACIVSSVALGIVYTCLVSNDDSTEAHASDVETRTTYSFLVTPTINVYAPFSTSLSGYYAPFWCTYHADTNTLTFPENAYYVYMGGGTQTLNPTAVPFSGQLVGEPENVTMLSDVVVSADSKKIVVLITIGNSQPQVLSTTITLQTLSSAYNVYNTGYDVGNPSERTTNTVYFSGATSSSASQNDYAEGFRAGRIRGDAEGYARGKAEGLELADNSTFTDLMNAVFYAPAHTLYSVLNFEVLGVNMFDLFTGVLSALLIIGVVAFVAKLIKGD